MGNQSKNQQSSIDRLPPDIREKLFDLLNDPRVTQLAATARINDILAEEEAAGTLPEDAPRQVSKSAVNRKAIQIEKVGRNMREARAASDALIGSLGSEPAGDVGKLLNEMVRTLVFRVVMRASEDAEADIDPELIKKLSISIHRLEQAAEKNAQVQKKIREQALSEAALRAEEAAHAQGMTEDQARFWREKVLGVA